MLIRAHEVIRRAPSSLHGQPHWVRGRGRVGIGVSIGISATRTASLTKFLAIHPTGAAAAETQGRGRVIFLCGRWACWGVTRSAIWSWPLHVVPIDEIVDGVVIAVVPSTRVCAYIDTVSHTLHRALHHQGSSWATLAIGRDAIVCPTDLRSMGCICLPKLPHQAPWWLRAVIGCR